MKKISIFLSICLIVLIKAQSVSDYKYVVIPEQYNDFKDNKSYGLDILIEKSLKSKKYIVLTDDKSKWPSEALVNPCKVLNTDLLNDKNLFRNKIILQFKDCSNKEILSEKAGSIIKEYEPGFQDALKQALLKIPVSNPKAEAITKSEPAQTIEEPKTINIAEPKIAQKYTNGKLTLQKIQIDGSQFILVDGNSSVPYATFKESTKKDVFRVKLSSGESTIGYYENGNIVIEIPSGNENYSKEVLFAN